MGALRGRPGVVLSALVLAFAAAVARGAELPPDVWTIVHCGSILPVPWVSLALETRTSRTSATIASRLPIVVIVGHRSGKWRASSK